MKAAIDSLIGVPGAMIAVPLASPSGIGPDSCALNSSSSCPCDMWSSCFASKAIAVSLHHFPGSLRTRSEVAFTRFVELRPTSQIRACRSRYHLTEQSTNGRLALSNADDPYVVLAQGDAVRIQTEKLYSKNVV